MFLRAIIILTIISEAASLLSLKVFSDSGESGVCFSDETDQSVLTDYLYREILAKRVVVELCYLSRGESFKNLNSTAVGTIIRTILHTELSTVQCLSDDFETSGLIVKKEPPFIPGPSSIIDCTDHRLLSLLITNLGPRSQRGSHRVLGVITEKPKAKPTTPSVEEEEEEEEEEVSNTTSVTPVPTTTTTRAPLLRKMGSPPLIATIMLLFQLSGLKEVLIDLKSHNRNRPGSGTNTLETSDDACKRTSYSMPCFNFDILQTELFPFTQSFISHYTLLEAQADKVVTKVDSSPCTIPNSSDSDSCRTGMIPYPNKCPFGFNGFHFIDNVGKLFAAKCAADHAISPDCKFCYKPKTGAQDIVVKGSSFSFQDAVCQKTSDEGPRAQPKLRGFCKIADKVIKTCKAPARMVEKMAFVSFTGKKYYLENLIIRQRQNSSGENFRCYIHTGEATGDVIAQGHRITHADPTKCKAVDSSQAILCSGDSIFCSHYNCEMNKPQAHCFYDPGSGPVEILIGGAWMMPNCFGYEYASVERENPPMPDPVQEGCPSCVTNCEVDGITIRTTGPQISSATACHHGFCRSIAQKSSTTIKMPYPGMSASRGGDIGVHISHEGSTPSAHIKVHCPPRDSCEAHNCIVCYRGLINYQCHTLLSFFVVSSLLVSASWVALYVTWRVLKVAKLMPARFKSPIVWLSFLIRWIFRSLGFLIKKSFQKLSERIGWDGQAHRNDVEAGPAVVYHGGQVGLRPIQRTFFLIAVLLISSCDSCANTELASSKISSCLLKGSNVVCSLRGSVILKAGPIGSESCLLVKNTASTQVKHISIKTVSSELVCREGQSFWTGLYTPKCISSHRCHLVSDCTGFRCREWNNRTISKEFAGVAESDGLTDNQCFESCGGIGCGCFNINPSCIFVHSKLYPVKGKALRVFDCVDWVHRLNLEVRYPSGNTEKVVLNSLGTKITEWGSLSLELDSEGMKASDSISFIDGKELGFGIVDEQISRVPRSGFLGEVRCASEAAAVSAHSSCITVPDLVRYKAGGSKVECTTNMVNPFTVLEKGALPQTRGKLTYTSSMDKTTVQAHNSGNVNALLHLELDDYEISFESTVSTCSLSLVNISGCYSCNPGAQLCFRSTCSPKGLIYVNDDSSNLHLVVPSDTSPIESCVIGHFNSPEIDIRAEYSCGGESKPVDIKGTLISHFDVDDRVTQGGSSVSVNSKESEWSFGEWSFGLLSWLGGPLKAILKIGFFILISIVAVYVCYRVALLIIDKATKRSKSQ
ncbi:Glycoprotein precursor [Itaporanga virus]|uniref:Envelopment polyprotein n=1 Tax=Itaporanga virus TaxID=629735 RepID=A0A4P8D7T3_9VIRU|nr:Glycoprotein precursor [Itaporanga virus]QCI62750.1 Glycoprotein precursor [Itaporanga virus]